MVKVRAATVVSVMVLLSATLSVSLAQDSWGDMTQVSKSDKETSDDNGNNGTTSSKSSESAETSNSAQQQSESVTQTSGDNTPSTESQTTSGGGGGGSTTPSTGGGTVPDGTWPTSTGTVQYTEAHVVKAGEVFDGKMQTFERSDVTCQGQAESGSNTAVFLVEAGGTLMNAIIGKNQMEGVHCDKHDCTIDNVWWDDVCEDALSIKGGTASSVSTVTGGGARSADDKVVQHNGFGTVNIDGFYGEDISKLYRSCGTCGDKARKVSVSNVYIVNPDNAIVTVNKNWGDEATLSNIWIKSAGDKVKICQWSQGNADGEPSMLGDGPSPPLCQYSESDVHINGDVSTAGGSSTPSKGSSPAASTESGGETPSSGELTESSKNDDGGAPAPSGNGEEEQSDYPTESSKNSDGDNKDKSSEDNKNSDGDNKDKSSDENKNSDGDNKDKSSEDNKNSDGDNKDKSSDDSTQQNDQDIMQQEVSGEATAWNETETATSTMVKSASDVEGPTLESSPGTTSAKCSIRRKRN